MLCLLSVNNKNSDLIKLALGIRGEWGGEEKYFLMWVTDYFSK